MSDLNQLLTTFALCLALIALLRTRPPSRLPDDASEPREHREPLAAKSPRRQRGARR